MSDGVTAVGLRLGLCPAANVVNKMINKIYYVKMAENGCYKFSATQKYFLRMNIF